MVLCSAEASVKKRNVDDRRAGLLNGGGGVGGGGGSGSSGSGERKRSEGGEKPWHWVEAQLLVNYISSNDDECFSTGDAFAWKSLGASHLYIRYTTASRCMDRMDVSQVQLCLANVSFLRSSYMYQSEAEKENPPPSAVSPLLIYTSPGILFLFSNSDQQSLQGIEPATPSPAVPTNEEKKKK